MKLRFLILAILMSGATAQTVSNMDDSPYPGTWGNCGLSCAGGTGSATSPFQFFGQTPNLDGAAMKLGFTGPALSPGQTTNYLWYWNAGPNANAQLFTSKWSFNAPSLGLIQELEFDTKQFQSGHRWFWGSQCNPATGLLQIWNQFAGTWASTTASCSSVAPGTFNSIIWQVRRIPGDTACASGQSCDYYTALILNGVNVTPVFGFTPQPSGPSGDADNTGTDTQIDMNSTGGTTSVNYDLMQFTASTTQVTNNDLYCIPGLPPLWGANDGPAQLPTAAYCTNIANTPATGAVVNVTMNDGTDLQNKLNTAVCGQKITLPAGSTYSGHFTLPAISCPSNNYLWIQTAGVASLPAEGSRYQATYNGSILWAPQFGPCYSGVTSQIGRPVLYCPPTPGTYTAKIITPGSSPALTFTAGTSGVRIIGIEFTRTSATGLVVALVGIQNIGNLDHIIIDRSWCHGDENQDDTESCFKTSAASYIAMVDSYGNNFYCATTCTEAKVVGGGGNTVNNVTESAIKLVNNFMEGAAQTTMFGGSVANTTPSDLEMRLNLMFKPLTWNPSDLTYNGGVAGHRNVVKNLIEFKNAQRVLVEGNEMQNVWGGSSQDGWAIVLTPKNQESGGSSVCPNCFVSNVTMRYNSVNTANDFAELTVTQNANGGLSAGGNFWSFHDNQADNLGYATCYQCPTAQSTIQIVSYYGITNPAQVEHDVSVNHNTFVYATGANPNNALGVSGPLIASAANMYNIAFTNNLMQSWGGVANSTGGGFTANCALLGVDAAKITQCWSPLTFSNNCFVNNGSNTWPGVNVTSVASYAAVFSNYNGGNLGNYTVAAGACKGAASDATDPGANFPSLAYVLAGNSASIPIPPSVLFGFTENNTAAGNFPSVSYGVQRLWDSPPLQWPSLNTAVGVFNFAALDTMLAQDFSNGVPEAMYTLARTPSWATSQPLDSTTCHYEPPAVGGGNGQCFAPSDLNADGSGTNAIWKAWITAIATHANDRTYLQTHAHIRYWEIWNEVDASFYWHGTLAQLSRLSEDANCIITGRGVIHQSGNGTATACTATPIDSTAVIVMASDTIGAAGIKYAQNQLYCNNTGGIPAYELPCANPLTATSAVVDVVNFHMKPGNAYPTTMEATLASYVSTIRGVLHTAELAKPLWDGEVAYATLGFVAPYNDPDMASSVFPRIYLSMLTQGITGSDWYTWDSIKAQPVQVKTSYQQTYNYLTGATLTTPCAATLTVWSCGITKAGVAYLVMWDTSKSCTGGICTTANQTVGSQWSTYADMTAAPAQVPIIVNTVPVGIKAVILSPGATFLLTVTTSGSGTVTSSPAGISCPATCGSPFPVGTVLNMTATPGVGYTFSGWTGACTGLSACVITMSGVQSVSAAFVPVSTTTPAPATNVFVKVVKNDLVPTLDGGTE